MLHEPKTGREVALRARTTFGRDAGNDVVLDVPAASSQHALVFWRKRCWWVRDLASRNGTWVQERRIAPGVDVPIGLGESVAFGDPRRRWWVYSVDPPRLFAESLVDGARVEAIDGVLGLPSNDDPQVMVFRSDPLWVIEEADGVRAAVDREVVVLDGLPWRLALPDGLEDTLGMTGRLGLRVHVTGSAWRPVVTVLRGDRVDALEWASCDRLLWVLAREREHDRRRAPADRGLTHLDLVADELGVEPKTVNVYVHRLRHRLGRLGVQDLIERRRGVGQLRLRFEGVEWAPSGSG